MGVTPEPPAKKKSRSPGDELCVADLWWKPQQRRSDQRPFRLASDPGELQCRRDEDKTECRIRRHATRMRCAYCPGRLREQPQIDSGVPAERIFAQRQQTDQAGQQGAKSYEAGDEGGRSKVEG